MASVVIIGEDGVYNIQETIEAGNSASLKEIVSKLISENINFIDTSLHIEQFFKSVSDVLTSGDNTIANGNVIVFLKDTININENFNFGFEIGKVVNDFISTSFIIQLDGKIFEAYAINLENNALTRYEYRENFNSFCSFDDEYFGMSKNGLFVMGGCNDDGKDIKSTIKTGYFNIANSQTKTQGPSSLRLNLNNLECAYLLINNQNQVKFTIVNDFGETFVYDINQSSKGQELQLPIGRGLEGHAFKFEISTMGDFKLDSCTIIPIVLNRRI